jgi:hypothetical protein
MRLSLRRIIIIRLLSAVGTLVVCYSLLHFQNRSWVVHGAFYSALLLPLTETPTTIPEKLCHKIGPHGLNAKLRDHIDSGITMNPSFRFEFITGISGDEFVKNHFPSRPNIVDNFLAINVPVVKAEILRYLFLYELANAWNDLDVTCEVPIKEWIAVQYKANTSRVVGIELDIDI